MEGKADTPRVLRNLRAPAAPIEITNAAERATWRRGFTENLKGRGRDSCPHRRRKCRLRWLQGWDAAEVEHR